MQPLDVNISGKDFFVVFTLFQVQYEWKFLQAVPVQCFLHVHGVGIDLQLKV